MKKSLLLGLGAVAMAFAAGAGIVAAKTALTSKTEEALAWDENLSISLKADFAGGVSFSKCLTLKWHGDGGTQQYEGTYYLPANTRFYFEVKKNDVLKNKIGYHTALSSNFSSPSGKVIGEDIVVSTAGFYQIYIHGKIGEYGGPEDGCYIWNEGSYPSSMIKLSDTPVIHAKKGDAAWADVENFAWNSTTHRYSATEHFAKGDVFGVKNGAKWMGYNAELDDTYFESDSGNIKVKKSGTYTVNLGTSYWFYDDQSYSFDGYSADDDTNKNYYFSYISVSRDNYDDVDDYVATYINPFSGDPEPGDSCETKFTNASSALAALSEPQQDLFETDAKYASARETLYYWRDHKDDNKAFVVPATISDTSSFMVIGLVALATIVTVGGFFFLRRRKEDR